MTCQQILIGQGARHSVFLSEPGSVIRVEKDGTKNTLDHCLRKLEYHNSVIMTLFHPFVARQDIASLGNSFVMKTDFVIRGNFCVELKPKYKNFIAVQQARGYERIFNPIGLWSRREDEIRDALSSAQTSDKPFLKIHRCGEGEELIDLVATALSTDRVHELMKSIACVSSWACETECLPIAKILLSKCVMDEKSVCRGVFCPASKAEFVALGRQLIESADPDKITKWINTYLTGRTARDVSLMFSFSQDQADLGEGSIFRIQGWWCRVALIDTEIKPSSKIS